MYVEIRKGDSKGLMEEIIWKELINDKNNVNILQKEYVGFSSKINRGKKTMNE